MGFLTLVRQLVQEKENSEFKFVKLHLKIDLVSHPAHMDLVWFGLVRLFNGISTFLSYLML